MCYINIHAVRKSHPWNHKELYIFYIKVLHGCSLKKWLSHIENIACVLTGKWEISVTCLTLFKVFPFFLHISSQLLLNVLSWVDSVTNRLILFVSYGSWHLGSLGLGSQSFINALWLHHGSKQPHWAVMGDWMPHQPGATLKLTTDLAQWAVSTETDCLCSLTSRDSYFERCSPFVRLKRTLCLNYTWHFKAHTKSLLWGQKQTTCLL